MQPRALRGGDEDDVAANDVGAGVGGGVGVPAERHAFRFDDAEGLPGGGGCGGVLVAVCIAIEVYGMSLVEVGVDVPAAAVGLFGELELEAGGRGGEGAGNDFVIGAVVEFLVGPPGDDLVDVGGGGMAVAVEEEAAGELAGAGLVVEGGGEGAVGGGDELEGAAAVEAGGGALGVEGGGGDRRGQAEDAEGGMEAKWTLRNLGRQAVRAWGVRDWMLRDWISRKTWMREQAAGVTPEMRLAWPSVRGRTRSSFSTISRERPEQAR